MLRRSWLCGGVTALLLALSSLTHAQPARPATKPSAHAATETDPTDPYEIGKAAFEAGRLTEALEAFETSYKQTKRPRALFRVGDTADKLGNRARAISAFREYLSLVPGSKDRPFIEGRIRANEAVVQQPGVQERSPVQPPRVGEANQPPTAAAPSAPTAATSGTQAAEDNPAGPLWLWAGAGVVAVAAIVVTGILVGHSSSSSTPEPVRGNVGGTIQTLGRP